MDTKIKAPKAKVMLWTDVSYHDMEQIDKMQCLPDLEKSLPLTLCSVLGADLPEPKRKVLLELYVHTVLFCREQSFKKEQTSSLLSIMKSVHEANTETPLNNIEQCFKYCKELLLCHSVRRPPFSINIFSPEEATCILKYIYDGYMRHYKLYKYIFTPQVKLDLALTYIKSQTQNENIEEDPPATGFENVLDKEEDAETNHESPPGTQETISEEHEGAANGVKSDLKALMEKEFKEQMTLVSGKLEPPIKT